MVGNLTIAVVLLVGRFRVIGADLTVGTLAAFLLYLRMFFEPDAGRQPVLQHVPVGIGCAGEAVRRVEEEPDVRPAPEPAELPVARGELVLDHVDFSYVPERVVIDDLDLVVPAGRPSLSSAPPAPARRRSPSCCRGSTTRHRVRSGSTVSTSGRCPTTIYGRPW